MPPRLFAVGGPLTGATIPLTGPEISVGRVHPNYLHRPIRNLQLKAMLNNL